MNNEVLTKDNINILSLNYLYIPSIGGTIVINISKELELFKECDKKGSTYFGKFNIFHMNTWLYFFENKQLLNKTLYHTLYVNGKKYETSTSEEYVRILAKSYYASKDNADKESKKLFNNYKKTHVKVKDLLDFLQNKDKNDFVHFLDRGGDIGGYVIENIEDLKERLRVSSKLDEEW